MKDLIYEYGGAVIGIVGALGMFWVMRSPFLAADGPLCQLVRFWIGKGC